MDTSIFSIYNNVEYPDLSLPTEPSTTQSVPPTKLSLSQVKIDDEPWYKKLDFSKFQVQSNDSNKEKMLKYKGTMHKLTEVLSTLRTNEPSAKVHYCTRAVSNALETISDPNHVSGIANPKVLHETLKSEGWQDVLDANYTPQAGDVWTYYENNNKMHSSMYDGNEWISYDKEGKTPWDFNANKTTKIGHIQRYIQLENSPVEETSITSFASANVPSEISDSRQKFEDAYDQVEQEDATAHQYRGLLTRAAERETGGTFNSNIKNKKAPAYGYFQFMQGYYNGTNYNNIAKYANTTATAFLNNPVLQIKAALALTKAIEGSFTSSDKQKALEKGLDLNTPKGLEIAIHACWLAGNGGFRKWLNGKNPSDGGMSVQQLINKYNQELV